LLQGGSKITGKKRVGEKGMSQDVCLAEDRFGTIGSLKDKRHRPTGIGQTVLSRKEKKTVEKVNPITRSTFPKIWIADTKAKRRGQGKYRGGRIRSGKKKDCKTGATNKQISFLFYTAQKDRGGQGSEGKRGGNSGGSRHAISNGKSLGWPYRLDKTETP